MPSLILTSIPLEPYCPGPVNFTCNATDIPPELRWELDDNNIGEYTFGMMDRFPLDLPFTSTFIDSIRVINANLDGNSLNIIINLTVSDLSMLKKSTLHCEDLLGRESNRLNVTIIQGTCTQKLIRL